VKFSIQGTNLEAGLPKIKSKETSTNAKQNNLGEESLYA
jgi:hypothetical protein